MGEYDKYDLNQKRFGFYKPPAEYDRDHYYPYVNDSSRSGQPLTRPDFIAYQVDMARAHKEYIKNLMKHNENIAKRNGEKYDPTIDPFPYRKPKMPSILDNVYKGRVDKEDYIGKTSGIPNPHRNNSFILD